MIGAEGKWRQLTVAEARKENENLIYWRPEMLRASLDDPDSDPAFVLESIEEVKRK